MKKLFIAALALVLTCGMASASSWGHLKAKKSQYTNTDSPIFVKASQPVVTIKLPSNRSTGYMWLLLNNSNQLVTPVSSRYIPSDTKRIGAMGTEVWSFKVKSEAFKVPQVARVVLIYAQPWNIQQANPVTINIVTEANGAVLKKQASLHGTNGVNPG